MQLNSDANHPDSASDSTGFRASSTARPPFQTVATGVHRPPTLPTNRAPICEGLRFENFLEPFTEPRKTKAIVAVLL